MDKAEKITLEIEKLIAERDKLLRKTKIKCDDGFSRYRGCGKLTEVSKITLIQTVYYVRPYSCTGGDYWANGEVQFKCQKCGFIVRVLSTNKKLREKIERLRYYFRKIERVET